jgi:hypothetical protein
MRFRFNLSHLIAGNLEISEPDGWKDAVMKLERHEEFHSLVEYFDGSFILYGNNGILNGGIDFVKAVEREHGPDATIRVQIDFTYDEVTFTSVFDGQYKITDLEEMPNNKMRIPIIRDDFWAKFIARLDTPVDLKSPTDLDGNQTALTQEVNIKLESQKVREVFYSKFDDGVAIPDPGNDFLNEYIQIEPTIVDLDEIKNKFTLPNATNPEKPVWQWEMLYGGEYTWDLRIEASDHTVIGAGGHPLDGLAKLFIQFNDQTPIEFTLTNHDDGVDESSVFTYQDTTNLAPGTIVRIYGFVNAALVGRFYIWGETNTPVSILFTKSPPSGAAIPSYFSVTANTIFPQTNSPAFLIHDVGAAITDRIIGQLDTFYCDYLGGLLTTARQYAENGCAWAYGIAKGLHLRQYLLSEKSFFMSFNQWWRGINPILNLSLMYDVVDDSPVIRVGKQEEQYNPTVSINFSNVRQITRKYDNDKIFNKVSIGYSKWQSEDISGLDDPQTKKDYATTFKKIGKPIQVYSEFIAASLAIETTRRQSRIKSADYKFDNETFIISLNPDLQEESPDVSPDLLQFMPEFSENFNSITNLLNPNFRYNLRITPARNFLRWQKYFQGAIQSYVGTEFRFVGGEGNYDMESEMVETDCEDGDYQGVALSEKQNIAVDTNYLHLPHLYECEFPMEWSEYETIRDNRKNAIGISQTDADHVPMFIKTLEYRPVKGTCTCLLWAREYLELGVVEDTAATQECYLQTACDDGITDELGQFLVDDFGQCITE